MKIKSDEEIRNEFRKRLRDEFEKRNIDASAICTEISCSYANRIKLVGKKVEIEK